MNGSFYLSLATFAYIIVISIVYFTKEKFSTFENKVYSKLLIVNLVSLISEISLALLYSKSEIITEIAMRIFLLCCVVWVSLLFLYLVGTFCSKNLIKYFKLEIYIIYAIAIIGIIFLPIKYIYDDTGVLMYSTGSCTNLVFGLGGIFIITMFILSFLNLKIIKQKKYKPIILFILLLTLSIIIQKLNPSYLLINFVFGLTIMLMYHTIENPDMRMIEQLNIARDQAEKANNAKSDFLSSMSHEIRTPLNAIVGFSQALASEQLSDEAKDEVKDIMMASETLLDLVNGILDISKIESGKLEIVDTEYNFKDTLNELVSLTKARLGEKPLEFRYNFATDIPEYVYGDKVRVKQIILNLLTNAVKYTKEGWIEFNVRCVKKDEICRLIISVEDSGIGIKQENIDKLFTRFERLDIEKNNTIEGTGLGLAITKKLIELMGGQIVVQSIYGKGSKFTVAIDQRIVLNPTVKQESSTELMSIVVDLSNKHILVVDDNKINLKVASRLLKDYGCEPDTLESGQECIDKILGGVHYDLILMDDMMPKLSGVETLQKLKEIPGYNIPTIALTANALSGMREKYLASGFSDYLSKPIDKKELNRVLVQFLSNK